MRARTCLPLACVALSSLAFPQSKLFVASSIESTSGDPWFMIDPDAGTVFATGQSNQTEGCYGAKFHPESGDLVVTSLTQQNISAAPVTNGVPDFGATVFDEPIPGRPYRLLYDASFKRFVTISGTGQSQVHIVEGDPAATNYGSRLDEVTIDSVEGYSLSADGTLFASVPLFFDGVMTMVDIEEDSDFYLEPTVTPPAGVQSGTFGLGTMISPDNRYVTVLAPTFEDTMILKFDRMTGGWIDVDPATPGLQHMTVDIAFAIHFAQIPGTETGIVVGNDFANNWIAKLDTTGPPSNWSLTQLQSFSGFPNALALSPDGTRFAITSDSTSFPSSVLIGETADGSITSVIPMPQAPINLVTLAWSSAEFGSVYCDPAVANSTGEAATITALGSNDVSANDVEIVLGSLPPGAFAMLLTSQNQGFVANPAGSQGNLCLGGSIGRYAAPGQVSPADAGGNWSLAIDHTATPQPTGLVAVQAGETWNYQAWYRDAIGGVAVSNFTPGFSIAYQ